jgi:hypothetical protein
MFQLTLGASFQPVKPFRWPVAKRGYAAVSWLLLAVGAAHAAVPTMPVTRPALDSGKPSYGSAHTPGVNALDLDKYGYVEEEYYLSGKAAVRDASGAVVLADAPYTTRILVRKPRLARRFSGNVVVTPFNWDRESAREWGFTKHALARRGDAFAGLTLVKYEIAGFPLQNGIKLLQSHDPVRYGRLEVYDHRNAKRQEMPQSQDILTQLAWLLKSNTTAGPLKGLKVRHLIAYSLGVGGGVLENYISQGRHLEYRSANGAPLFDAYMVGANPLLPVPPAAQRADAVFVLIQNEREFNRDTVAGLEVPVDSDKPGFRLYDFVGSPHLGKVVSNEQTGESELGNDTPEVPRAAAPRGATADICRSHNNAPVGLVQSALLTGVMRWVSEGVPLPQAPRVERAGAGLGEKIDPKSGNALGGLRPPWIEVPAATYYSGASQGCGVWEPMQMYDADQLQRLYGSYENYARQFAEAKVRFVKAGFLLPTDAVALQPVASRGDFGAQ